MINKKHCLTILISLVLHLALGQPVDLNGSFPVKESWTVTVYRGASDSASTFTGTETGTLVMTNGTYKQINHIGATLPSRLNTTETIYYEGTTYNVSTAYPFSAEGSSPSGIYAVIQLTFFVIVVPLGSAHSIYLCADPGRPSQADERPEKSVANHAQQSGATKQ